MTLPLHIYSIHNRRKGEKVHASLTEMAKQLKGEIKMSSKMPNYRYWDINEEKRQFNVNVSGPYNATMLSYCNIDWR